MTTSALRSVLDVVRESAERRLGRPLLILWLVVLVTGVAIVAGSVAWMYVGPGLLWS